MGSVRVFLGSVFLMPKKEGKRYKSDKWVNPFKIRITKDNVAFSVSTLPTHFEQFHVPTLPSSVCPQTLNQSKVTSHSTNGFSFFPSYNPLLKSQRNALLVSLAQCVCLSSPLFLFYLIILTIFTSCS